MTNDDEAARIARAKRLRERIDSKTPHAETPKEFTDRMAREAQEREDQEKEKNRKNNQS